MTSLHPREAVLLEDRPRQALVQAAHPPHHAPVHTLSQGFWLDPGLHPQRQAFGDGLADAMVEPVYLWADGIYVKAGLEKDKAALLVVIAGLRDGRKMVLAVTSGHRESVEGWSAILRDLKARGLNAPKLVGGDGNRGLLRALSNPL